MLPCLKKISYSVLKQAESNKVHTTKEHFLQKQRKAQQDTVKLVKFCHPVTNRKTDNNIDIKQRNDCFVEKYSTLRNIERHHSSQRSGRCWYLVIGVTLLRGPNFFDIIRYLYIKCEINNYRFKYISCGIKPTLYRVALASLTATYTDSEGEDGADDNFQDNSNSPTEATARSDRSASSSPSDSSNHSSKNNNLPNVPTLVTDVTSKVQRLVSYFDDTVVSDDEGTAVAISEHVFSINGRQHSDVREKQSPDRPLISDNEADEYGVIIPPEPPSACPSDLQEKISKLYVKMEDGRLDMNKVIQNRKDFRNPSIYEKLIQFCNINELGTNYPPDRFDPFKWSKDSYYEELAKAQKVEMEKLEKARKEKTKIEIVSGTAKRPNPTPAVTEEDIKKRKSKWDQVATNPLTGTAVKPAVVTQPALTTLTSSVTGTKTTVISAFGSVPKKRL
ncbi:uncharacterized protein LOC131665218 [Phymastichus coffea]|uniref:uncharacterized protein LOC131665218 n=1 Tax=Phymastichus coffea TaxID=108790 RepID=UPI00273A8085|nr:uncharacterized protein LOC131665218 [Phymastichus coffea]